MGDITSVVDWWQEWQLRILVLTSLAVQVLLFVFSSLRRFAIPGWARSITWLAYLAGDAVAIYALATLFNRHRHEDGDGGSNIVIMLEVMWAPVLLLHLGGPDSITAYDIEDNELWSRHVLTAVSQVTVAIYVFCKSWPSGGDKRLLAAVVLLFIPGVLKCFVKPWALKSASIHSLVSSDAVERFGVRGDIYSLKEYVEEAKEYVGRDQQEKERPLRRREHGGNVVDDVATSASVEDADLSPSQGRLCAQLLKPLRNYWRSIKRKEFDKLAKQKQENRKMFQELGMLVEGTWQLETGAFADQSASHGHGRLGEELQLVPLQLVEIRRRLLVLGEASYKLFVDLSSPYRLRLSILKYCWGISEGRACANVERWLAAAFLRLYTKLKTAGVLTENDLAAATDLAATLLNDGRGRGVMFGCRQLIYCSRLVLPLVSISLFHRSHSKALNHHAVDVDVTFAVFYCTAVLEICSVLAIFVGEFASWKSVSSSQESGPGGSRWPEMVAQYSLIGYFASYKRHVKWMCIADIFGCTDFVDRRMLCMKSCSSSAILSRLVLGYLKDGWKEEIHDPLSYHRFNDHSSRWVLVKEEEENSRWVLKRNQCSSQVPGMGMKRWPLSFDECVLIWHVATDICFFKDRTVSEHPCAFAEVRTAWNRISSLEFLPWVPRTRTNEQQQQHQCRQELTPRCRAVLSRQMSNYMVYLLFVNPEMLLPGARRNLFTDACIELNKILKDMDNVKADEKCVMPRVIDALEKRSKSKEANKEQGGRITQESINDALAPLLDDAWALAQMMLDNDGNEKMWEEIQRVWVEMLCFSASRCRGYLHAKALGEGGEFLSYVWLTLFHMGMETFTDKLHREEPPSVSRAVPPPSAAPPSTSEICRAGDDMV